MKKKLLALSIGVLSLTTVQVFSQEDSNSYREGYQLILEQQWDQARNHFQEFQTQWADSAWADDAAFWQCYAMEQMSTELNEHYTCYESFLSNWPESSWVADARGKLIVLSSHLAQRGSPQYLQQMVRFFGDDDPDVDVDFDFDFDDIDDTVAAALDRAERELERVRIVRENMIPPVPPVPTIPDLPDTLFLSRDGDEFSMELENTIREAQRNAREMAERARETYRFRSISRNRSSVDDELLSILAALRDNERASDILLDRLEASDDPQLRSRIVLLLEDVPGERISNTLLDLVDSDESEMVRNNAIIVLLDRNEPLARSRLLEIVDDEAYPVSIRAEIIGDLDNWEENEALETLGRVLNNSSEPALIEEAADALADIGSEESVAMLLQGFAQQEDIMLRHVMLEEITDLETPRVMNFLSEIALNNEDDGLAAIAIDGIADREDNIGVAALEHIYLQSSNQQRRLAALIGIGEAENAYAFDVISELIANESDPDLLAVAASSLGRTGQEDAVNTLMAIYSSSSDANVHRSVIRGLRRLERYPSATDAMLQILEDRLASAEAQ